MNSAETERKSWKVSLKTTKSWRPSDLRLTASRDKSATWIARPLSLPTSWARSKSRDSKCALKLQKWEIKRQKEEKPITAVYSNSSSNNSSFTTSSGLLTPRRTLWRLKKEKRSTPKSAKSRKRLGKKSRTNATKERQMQKPATKLSRKNTKINNKQFAKNNWEDLRTSTPIKLRSTRVASASPTATPTSLLPKTTLKIKKTSRRRWLQLRNRLRLISRPANWSKARPRSNGTRKTNSEKVVNRVSAKTRARTSPRQTTET